LWELLANLRFLQSDVLPPLSKVLKALKEQLIKGLLIEDILISLKRVGIGFIIGSISGILVSILSARYRIVHIIVSPLLELIRHIPPIAWIPIALLWFGFGNPPAYFLVSLGAFFPVLSDTREGIAYIERCYQDAALVLGLTAKQRFFRILLPQTIPSVLTGFQTAMGVSWMIVVAAELIGAQSGLGYMIQVSRAQLQTELVVGGMLVIGVIGLILSIAIRGIRFLLLPWKRRGRELISEQI